MLSSLPSVPATANPTSDTTDVAAASATPAPEVTASSPTGAPVVTVEAPAPTRQASAEAPAKEAAPPAAEVQPVTEAPAAPPVDTASSAPLTPSPTIGLLPTAQSVAPTPEVVPGPTTTPAVEPVASSEPKPTLIEVAGPAVLEVSTAPSQAVVPAEAILPAPVDVLGATPGAPTDGSAPVLPAGGRAGLLRDFTSVDLQATKTAPPYFTPGDALTYTVTVTNNGDTTVPSGWSFDDLVLQSQSGLRNGQWSISYQHGGSGTITPLPASACGTQGGPYTDYNGIVHTQPSWGEICTIPTTIAPGETITFYVTVNTNKSFHECITNDVYVGATVNGVSSHSHDKATSCPEPSLEVSKTVTPTTFSHVGETLVFDIWVTNNTAQTGFVTGGTNISALSVTDALAGGTVISNDCVATYHSTLATDQRCEVKVSYTITQADLDRGSVTNHATATATAGGKSLTGDDSATATALQDASLTLTKTASRAEVSRAGDTVTYTFAVANDGNVTVHGIAIAEGAFNGSGSLSAATCLATTLAPFASTTCTATYVVTQADIDAGATLENHATATGVGPMNQPAASDDAWATVDVTQSGKLTLTKSADP
ncbi:MAG: hypothetical protein FWC46_02960, partial [Actinomycetia bacterium]|nr:hypothetical protein [Actinomycetes bacterium]